MAKSMAQLTSAMTSPRRMRKTQSSPTLEMRNRWHCKAQTAGTRAGSEPGAPGMGTPGWQGQAGRYTSAHNWRHRPSTTGTVRCGSTTVPSRHSHTTTTGGQDRRAPAVHSHTRCCQARTSHQHGPPGMAPGRGAGGLRSLRRARLF